MTKRRANDSNAAESSTPAKKQETEPEKPADTVHPQEVPESDWLSDGTAYSKALKELDITKSGRSTPTQHKIFKDPFCDPQKPRQIQFQNISAASFKIRDGISRTPCTKSNQLSQLLGVDLHLKHEFLQLTGSFKERGARFTLMKLSNEQKKLGVIAASAGNHALALSYHGELLGIPVTVVMPVIAPLMKVNRCRQFGANVMVRGNDISESKEIAMQIAQDKDLQYVNGYDHPDILAGQGTIALEIIEQVPDIDAVIIPVGGGGLIAGMALAFKYLHPEITVIGVEAQSCPSFQKSIEAGKPVFTQVGATLADGLSVPLVGVNAFHTAKNLIDKMVSVDEGHIALAILRLIEIEKAIVEGAGAVGVAALLAGKLPELQGKRVVTVLCGGNIDTTVLGRCIERGLAADGRLIRFEACTSDRPGGLAELTALLAQAGASIKDIHHERAWLRTDVYQVRVKCFCETRDWEHANELEQILRKQYPDVEFNRNIMNTHMMLNGQEH